MDIQEFLSRHHSSLPDLQRAARRVLGLADADVLIAVGSLIDGVGTSSSDIDLILLTDRTDLDYNACMTDIAVLVGQVLADIRVIAFSEFDELLARFGTWSMSPRVPRRAFEFSTDERKLLYRMSTGVQIHGPRAYGGRMRAAVSALNLARHKLDAARHLGSTYLIDLQGLFADARYSEMIPIAQDLCNQAVDAMLSGWQVGNPNGKWRTAYLSQLPADWHHRMPNVMSPGLATDAIFDISRSPHQDYPAAIVEFTSRICAFARMAFIWAEDAVLRGDVTTKRWRARDPNTKARGALKVPVVHFDVDINIDDDAVWIARLNQPGPAQALPPEALSVLVWGDGQTTVDQLGLSPTSISAALQFVTAGDYVLAPYCDGVLLDDVLGRG